MKTIPFYSDEIKIKPHSATDAKHLCRSISLREFSQGQPVSLYEHENGELLARLKDGKFIEGPEVVA